MQPHAPALTQHPTFAATLALMGARPDRVETADGPVLVTRRRCGPFALAAALRAPPLSPRGLLDLRQHGVGLCEPDRAQDLRAAGFLRLFAPVTVAELPLAADESGQRARMAGKWRNRLHRAERAGLAIRDLPFAGPAGEWLIAREGAQRRARRYGGLHPDFARAWARAAPGSSCLLLAQDGDDWIAGMLFLIHGSRASYHLGWSGARGRAVSAHHLILARAAALLAARGVHEIDLGRIDPDRAPGLCRFKTGAGAILRPLGGSWIALPPPLARALSLAARRR